MDLKFETEATFLNDSKAWLGAREGVDDARTVTLDLSLFTAGTHFPNGFIPSGMTLGKVTASGLYGPYNNALATGVENFRGHLLSGVEVRATNVTGRAVAAMLWRGTVKESKLPTNHGLDAAAKADAGPTSALVGNDIPNIRYEA